ncbi:MAG: hypothetical protein GC164_00970 [Phycisphaera sp.]|nr:hypothetical protein [Phycisphaera sp.]
MTTELSDDLGWLRERYAELCRWHKTFGRPVEVARDHNSALYARHEAAKAGDSTDILDADVAVASSREGLLEAIEAALLAIEAATAARGRPIYVDDRPNGQGSTR